MIVLVFVVLVSFVNYLVLVACVIGGLVVKLMPAVVFAEDRSIGCALMAHDSQR